ncbi:MAG: T9SS type A sorting domain-containing protein, partial [Bacteroidales bacterium]|nr:T9SS type A sorting domain-containing protein [Bacteroidales bacterium]
EDGGSDLGIILGEPASFTEGLQYFYSGDNSWIDHIAPQGEAFTIFQNQSPEYINAVAFDGGSYRTIGSSFEFGGLEDAESSKDYLMHKYLEFFGIQSIWVSLPERPEAGITAAGIYPNPFHHQANISFSLEDESNISVEVYNAAGQLMGLLINERLGSGSYSFIWNGEGATDGIYFFRIIGEDGVITRKAVKMQ